MNPGRELDALVAEKVMGLKVIDGLWVRPGTAWHPAHGQFDMNTQTHLLRYSTDIAAAWEVLEQSGLLDLYFLYKRGDQWAIGETNGVNDATTPLAEAPTAPHAICLAALKAVGDKI